MDKAASYEQFLKEARALLDPEIDRVGNMANLSALYMSTFKPHWVGFYLVKNGRLELGPFQGPVACTRIELGKGVCGSSWKDARTIIVDNVHEFPGHIACSPLSNSEIVVPCFEDQDVYAVLDIDSEQFNAFDSEDQNFLEQAVKLI